MSVTAETARRDWRDRAACLDEDPELFFPIGSTGPALAQIEEAKAVCARCPVLAECRAWALDNPTLAGFGVFGGLSEEERRAAVRRRRRNRAATPQAS
jgi:WhiB family redox-sensing transcriptional regulator